MPAVGVVVADQSFPSSAVLTNSYILGNCQTPGDATELSSKSDEAVL